MHERAVVHESFELFSRSVLLRVDRRIRLVATTVEMKIHPSVGGTGASVPVGTTVQSALDAC